MRRNNWRNPTLGTLLRAARWLVACTVIGWLLFFVACTGTWVPRPVHPPCPDSAATRDSTGACTTPARKS